MRAYRTRYTQQASTIIKKLHPTIKAAIRAGIGEILKAPLAGRELQYELRGFRSFRVSRYRVIYRINEEEQCIEIHYVGARRDVYESFRELVSGKTTGL